MERIILSIPIVLIFSQDIYAHGIHFENDLFWQDVPTKAKYENQFMKAVELEKKEVNRRKKILPNGMLHKIIVKIERREPIW